jgi:hypothetical protein
MDTESIKPMEYKGARLTIPENSHDRIQLFRPTQDVVSINWLVWEIYGKLAGFSAGGE